MKHIIIVLLLFTLSLPLRAEVDIDKSCFVKNKPNGYCVYASLEIIGKHYKDKRLYGLVDYYSQWPSVGAGTNEVRDCLGNLGVPYKIYENSTMEWLKEQVDNEIPIIVALKWPNGHHAVVVVDVSDTWVKYIDSNDIRKYQYVNREWFEWSWQNSFRPEWSVKLLLN